MADPLRITEKMKGVAGAMIAAARVWPDDDMDYFITCWFQTCNVREPLVRAAWRKGRSTKI